MSILKALQDYLSGYDGMQPMRILTDRVEDTASYAVAPTGNTAVIEDVLGNRTYENDYVFLARECTADEIDRQENYDFLEGLYDWLESAPLPELPGQYEAEKITPSNIMLIDVDDRGTGVYQIQIKLTISKRR
jgi:hypothetical protein